MALKKRGTRKRPHSYLLRKKTYGRVKKLLRKRKNK